MVLHQTYPKCLVHKHKPNPNPETKIQPFSSMAKEQQKLERGSLQPQWMRKKEKREPERFEREKRRKESEKREERRKRRWSATVGERKRRES